MLGNDVVDLGDPESRAEARHPRFDACVFDRTERALIAASPHGEFERWRLWAAKESAYKAARKEDPRTVFAPRRFAVRRTHGGMLAVTVGDRRFRVEVVVDGECVHAVARHREDSTEAPWTAVASLSPTVEDAGVAVRRLATTTIARRLGLATDDLVIDRVARIPTLRIVGRGFAADLSLAHHGRFVAFACSIRRSRP